MYFLATLLHYPPVILYIDHACCVWSQCAVLVCTRSMLEQCCILVGVHIQVMHLYKQ